MESNAFDLGTRQGFTVRQVLDSIAQVTGRTVPHDVGPRCAGDPAALVADPSAANRDLGWQPRICDLESIVASALAWRQKVHG